MKSFVLYSFYILLFILEIILILIGTNLNARDNSDIELYIKESRNKNNHIKPVPLFKKYPTVSSEALYDPFKK